VPSAGTAPFEIPQLRYPSLASASRSHRDVRTLGLAIELAPDTWPVMPDEKRDLLEAWMAVTAEKYLEATPGVGNRAWDVFEEVVERGGSISPSDFADFGFETSQAMRGQMRALEDATLVESSVDETDKRRRLFEVTARGWIRQLLAVGV
jgi:hypothetical protein